jgi:uncharacterized membrane protein
MSQPMGDVTDDDRLWAALALALTPITPIIILLMSDKKERPFIKAVNMPALIWGIAIQVLTWALSFLFVGICIGLAGFAIQLYWAWQAYQGKTVTIPVLWDLAKNQGWA